MHLPIGFGNSELWSLGSVEVSVPPGAETSSGPELLVDRFGDGEQFSTIDFARECVGQWTFQPVKDRHALLLCEAKRRAAVPFLIVTGIENHAPALPVLIHQKGPGAVVTR